MARLESIDGDDWRAFVDSPIAVLVIGKTTCPACEAYRQEIEAFLATDTDLQHVRLGKLELDRRGLTDFKRQNPWLATIDSLPFTRIYRDGHPSREFAGGGIERLRRRLSSLRDRGARPGAHDPTIPRSA